MSQRPKLTSKDLDDADRLFGIVDGMFVEDRTFWRFNRRLCKLQLHHQSLVSEEGFIAQLEIEAAMDERMKFMLVETARWAFEQGRRSLENS